MNTRVLPLVLGIAIAALPIGATAKMCEAPQIDMAFGFPLRATLPACQFFSSKKPCISKLASRSGKSDKERISVFEVDGLPTFRGASTVRAIEVADQLIKIEAMFPDRESAGRWHEGLGGISSLGGARRDFPWGNTIAIDETKTAFAIYPKSSCVDLWGK